MDRTKILTRLFALAAYCAFLLIGGCATAQKEPVEPEISVSNTPTPEIIEIEEEVIYSPVLRLQGLESWELLSSSELVEEFYEVKTAKTEKMDGTEVRITVREARFDEMMDVEVAPMTLVTISSNGYEVRQPLYPDRRMEFEYSLPKSKPQLLSINESCGCADPYADKVHLFTIYKNAIRPLGALSGVVDDDDDGLLEPFVYDISFSNGLGIMEGWEAPVIKFFFSVDRGRLVAGSKKHDPYYSEQVGRLSEVIVRGHAESPDSGDLAPVLEKFLYLKAMGMEKKGWKELERDVMLYGENGFPQRRPEGEYPRLFALEEIASRIRKALGKDWMDR
jgi:hypothetical protein